MTGATTVSGGRRGAMLLMALLGFAVNFWAWGIMSPLGPHYGETLKLSSFAQSFLVSVPVVVGSLGRVPIGALTDRFGGRIMFPAVSFITILPLLFLANVSGYGALILGGFVLGIAGAVFAVGVPFVNGWFPPDRRGFAIGVYGMGMGGTAIAALTTVRLMNAYRISVPFYLVAIVLAAYGLLALAVLRDPPGRTRPTGGVVSRTASTMRIPATWQLSFLYAIAFGGIVAFGVYLPTYLKSAYHLSPGGAALRAAGFTLVAVVARPIGGALSDRVHPARVLVACFGITALCAVVQAFQPRLLPTATIALLVMAFMLGAASGAVFALVPWVAPAGTVGAVTGIVGACGGLGGFVPPLVMGAVYGAEHSYAIGLMLLSDLALAACVYAAVRMTRFHRPGTAGSGAGSGVGAAGGTGAASTASTGLAGATAGVTGVAGGADQARHRRDRQRGDDDQKRQPDRHVGRP